jgi:aryl-alcohol dehydrogenase-like predicted oxidoreductase
VDIIRLQNTDLDVSRVCFGTMTMGKQTGEAMSRRLVDRCLDAGINFFDTANMYNLGAAEEILGRAFEGRRGRIILASKVRYKMGDAPDQSGLSRAAILRAIDESLRRLRTDYLDIYYLHWPDRDVPMEETLAAMDEVVRAGKVRYPACSNYAAWEVVKLRCIADKCGYKPIHIYQSMYNLVARNMEYELVPMCREFGISNVSYNPLAGGLLTGKHQREAPIPGTRFDNNKLYLDRYWHEDYFRAVEELQSIAKCAGRSLVSLALNWVLRHSATDVMILGASNIDQLEQNLAAIEEGPLSPDVLAACDRVWAKLRGVTPAYNR